MKFENILSDLKNKIYYPVYFLMGEEPYFIDQVSDYIEKNILTESEKEFNQTIVYGKDISLNSIISYAKRFPMMANFQVLIVKEAQHLEKLDELLGYIENPLKSTILVFCYKYKTIDKRTKLTKAIEKNGVLFESKKLYEDKIPQWINSYLKQRNYSIEPSACILLAEYLGNDISKIVNELNKIFINIPVNQQITSHHIEQNTGISKDYNIFELQKAFAAKDAAKAFQIIQYFSANTKEHPFLFTTKLLYIYFSKILTYHYLRDRSKNNIAAALSINPFFVNDYVAAARSFSPTKIRQIITLLREYDAKSKGVDNSSTTEGELLKELTYKILH